MKMHEVYPGIYVADEKIVEVTDELIDTLKAKLPTSDRKRVRLCAHPNVEDPVHEMLIVMSRDGYVQPHCHASKSESFHIVEGKLDVVVFRDDGDIDKVIQMGDYKSGKVFFYRIPPAIFHTVVIDSDTASVHEISKGPFEEGDAVFAPWAPNESDEAEAQTYMTELSARVQAFKANGT